MKRIVRVIIEKEVEVDIPDALLTQEHIEEFHSFIGLNSDTGEIEECRTELFEYVARLKAAYEADHAEGMGYMGSRYMKEFAKDPEGFIVAEVTYEDVETEMVE